MREQQIRSMGRIAILLLAAALLTSCGPSSKSRESTTLASRGSSSSDSATKGAAGIECSMFDSKDTRLSGKVTTYYSNQVVQEDKIRLRITSLIEKFDQSQDVYLQVFRWKADGSGKTTLDSLPLTFYFEKDDFYATRIDGTFTSLNLKTISDLRGKSGLGGTGSVDFFGRSVMVVTGVSYDWQAIKVVLYQGTTAIGQADVLLPIFTANPNIYAQTHSHALNQLHPFWSQRSQSLTDADWVGRADSYCF